MIDDEQAKVALKAFFNIGKRWQLNEDDEAAVLGQPDRIALRDWKIGKGPELVEETIVRISYVLGIFKAINLLLPIPERADAWISKPNKAPIFGGRSALDRMTDGGLEDLKVVRQYLDAEVYA